MFAGPEPRQPDPQKTSQDKYGRKHDTGQAQKGTKGPKKRQNQAHLPTTSPTNLPLSDREWQRIAKELRSHKEAQTTEWQGVDEMLIARYLLNSCTEEEV